MAHNSFWKGSRGEWYLVVQIVLLLLLIFGPQKCRYLADWPPQFTWIGSLVGGFLLLFGTLLATCAAFNLGRNLTPLPVPKENATLIISGAYRFVRHPIYSGLIFMAIGWGLLRHSWLTLGYALLLFIFFDIKSRLEERMLAEKFQEYAEYRKRIRKLIPFVF